MALTLAFDDRGSGTPLVLLHGFPLDRRIFTDAAELLSNHFRVITIDLPGFGQSTADIGDFTMRSMAEAVHDWLSQRGLRRCILGGLSMGGYVAQEYAGHFSDDLLGLALINTKAAADSEEARRGRDAMADLARQEGAAPIAEQMFPKVITASTIAQRPEIATLVRMIMNGCRPSTIQRACLAMRDRADYTAQLATYRFPTLVVTGSEDPIATPAIAEAMRKPLKDGLLAVIEGAAHLSPLEQPAAFAETVQRFFAS